MQLHDGMCVHGSLSIQWRFRRYCHFASRRLLCHKKIPITICFSRSIVLIIISNYDYKFK